MSWEQLPCSWRCCSSAVGWGWSSSVCCSSICSSQPAEEQTLSFICSPLNDVSDLTTNSPGTLFSPRSPAPHFWRRAAWWASGGPRRRSSSAAVQETDDTRPVRPDLQIQSTNRSYTHPGQTVEQQLREAQRGSGDLRWTVVHHVVVEEGQLHQILGQCVFLYVRLKQKFHNNLSINQPVKTNSRESTHLRLSRTVSDV